MKFGPPDVLRSALMMMGAGPSGAGGGGGYALDGATTDLALAYSLSRRLLSSYEGDLILVRRSSDDAELAIGFDEEGLLDEAALLAFCGAGDGYVVTVYDQSGSGRDFIQATASAQAILVDGGALIGFGSNTRAVMECVGGLTAYNASFGGAQTPSAITYAFAGVAGPSGDYNGQVGDPGASWNTNGSILLFSTSNTSLQNRVGLSNVGNGLTIVQGADVLAGVECGPANVTHYQAGIANTPGAHSPTLSFASYGLWNNLPTSGTGTTGARFAEGALWLGAQGAAVAALQTSQVAHFGI